MSDLAFVLVAALAITLFVRALTKSTAGMRKEVHATEEEEMSIIHAQTPKSLSMNSTFARDNPSPDTIMDSPMKAADQRQTSIFHVQTSTNAVGTSFGVGADRFESLLDGRNAPRPYVDPTKLRKRVTARRLDTDEPALTRLEVLLNGKQAPHIANAHTKLPKRVVARRTDHEQPAVTRLEALLDGTMQPRVPRSKMEPRRGTLIRMTSNRLEALLEGTVTPRVLVQGSASKGARRIKPQPIAGIFRLERLLDGTVHPKLSPAGDVSKRRVEPIPMPLRAPSSYTTRALAASDLVAALAAAVAERKTVIAAPAAPRLGASQALPQDTAVAIASAQLAAATASDAAGRAIAAYQLAQERQERLVAEAESRARIAAAAEEAIVEVKPTAASSSHHQAARHRKAGRLAAPSAGGASHKHERPPLRHMTTSVYDASLRRAFDSVDRDHSGSLSKRQLYAALAMVQLACAPSEQLKIWELFDRDHDGKITYEEFRRLGAVLLELAEAMPKRQGRATGTETVVGGTFARRDAVDTQRMHYAASRIQGLARQRSMEQFRMAALGRL